MQTCSWCHREVEEEEITLYPVEPVCAKCYSNAILGIEE